MKIEYKCQHYPEAPGCLGDIDEQWTMNFDDIGKGSIYWCSSCGPRAHAMDKLLMDYMLQSPENVQKVKDALDKVKCTHKTGKDA